MTEDTPSLQDRYAPHGRCFGCGPSNPKGLRIKSRAAGSDPMGEVIADWIPEPHHEAFESVLNGGIIGALLDCHSNWTAAWHLMVRDKQDGVPSTVTAEFHVKLRRPTPSKDPVRLQARVTSSEGNVIKVSSELLSGGKVTATCNGTFVAVEPGHPAYHRW